MKQIIHEIPLSSYLIVRVIHPLPFAFSFFSPSLLLYFVFCVSEPRGLSLSDMGSAPVKLIMTEICAGLAFFLPFSARRWEWGERSGGKVAGWVGGSGGWGWDEGRPSLRGGGVGGIGGICENGSPVEHKTEKKTERPLSLKYTTCFYCAWINATEITVSALPTNIRLYLFTLGHSFRQLGVFVQFQTPCHINQMRPNSVVIKSWTVNS